jgi:ketosteroid isomerase-like protein
MAAQSEIEANKAVADAFYQAGVEGKLTSFARYLAPDFLVTAPSYLPWGGPHKGASFFSGDILPNLPQVFDFSRFSYLSVTAEGDRVAAIINMGVAGTGSGHQDPRSLDDQERQSRRAVRRLFRAAGASRQAWRRARAEKLNRLAADGERPPSPP